MTKKNNYEKLNQLVNQDMLDDILSEADDCDMIASAEIDTSLGPNTHIKRFINEHKGITTSNFGQLIGIEKPSTSRCKVNRQSKMTMDELKKASEVIGVDVEVLKVENLMPKEKEMELQEMVIGEITDTSRFITLSNLSGKIIRQIKLRTVSNHKTVKLLMMDQDQLLFNNMKASFVFEPEWGQNFDLEIVYTDGTTSYVDGMVLLAIEWLEIRRGNDYATNIADHTEAYMLLQFDPSECEYFTVTYLTYTQAEKFIRKYANVDAELNDFLLASTGELCNGKYCLIEA